MSEDTNEEERLHGASNWQIKPKQTDSRLGEEIESYLKRHARTFEKNAPLMDVWEQVVPESMLPYCRPDKRVGNVLYVQAMPGAYMHRMQTIAGEVLEKIQRLSPRSGIQKIRIIPLQEMKE